MNKFLRLHWSGSVVLFFFISCMAMRAQWNMFEKPEHWRWAHFTTENGLPSVEIRGLIEDIHGTVWVATATGVAWYDGFFWHEVGPAQGLPERPAKTIFTGPHGEMIVLIDSVLYTGTIRGFQPLPVADENDHRLKVLEAVPFSNESLLLLLRKENSSRPTLYIYARGGVAPFPMPSAIPGNIVFGDRMLCLQYTKAHHIWMNTEKGLYRLDQYNWTLVHAHEPRFSNISHILEDQNGNGYFFLSDIESQRGLWQFEKDKPAVYTTIGKYLFVVSADMNASGDVFVAYSSGLIGQFRKGEWKLFTPVEDETIGLYFVRFSENGDVWVQTTKRLSLYRASAQRWEYRDYGYLDAWNHVNEILKTRDGSLWVATGSGLQIHKPNGHMISMSRIDSVELIGVTGLAQDRDGCIWITSGGNFDGAWRWDGTVWKHFGAAEGLNVTHIHKVNCDRSGRLWFLTLQVGSDHDGYGAFVLDNGKFTQWNTPQGLLGSRVYSFVESKDGSRWFGTKEGLSRWRNGKWKYWPSTSNQSDKFYALAVDSNGRVWFSRLGYGFGFIEGENMHMVSLPSENGGHIMVMDIKVDTANRLWISTLGDGLFCYNQGIISHIQLNEGLGSLNLWPLLPDSNHVFIGTLGRGLDILRLDEQRFPNPIALVDKPLVEDNTVFLRWRPASYWGQIPVEEIETRYRINHGPWSTWSRHTEVLLKNMNAGTYTFQVQAKGLFATMDNELTLPTTSFAIPAPFYSRPLFYIPVFLSALTALWLGGVTLVRKRRYNEELQKMNAMLERKVSERTEELEQVNRNLQSEITQRTQAEEDLRQALAIEKELGELKSRFVTMVSHEFRTPLSIILSSAELIDRYEERLAPLDRQKYFRRIYGAVKHITELMNDVLFLGRAETGKLVFLPEEFDLEELCQEIVEELLSGIGFNRTILSSYQGATGRVVMDKKLLRSILINLLSNALKYSPETKPVSLSVSVQSSDVSLRVQDEGIGIPAEDIQKIFDTFYRTENVGVVAGTGLGLAIVKECVMLHGGTISVESKPGHTTFTVQLPSGLSQKS